MNAYQRKFSSGLILALLSISAITLLGSFALPARAANSQFSASLTYPYVTTGVAGAVRDFKVSNPAGNSGITEIDLSISTSAAAAVTGAASVDGFIGGIGASVGGSGPWTIVYVGAGGAVILPQGAAGHLSFTFTSEAAESTSGTADSYTLTLLVDYKDGSTQTGTLTLVEGAAASVATTLVTTSPQTVGTSISYSAALNVADSGVPLTWTSSPSVSAITTAGFSASFTPASGSTDATGTATTRFVSTEAGAGYTATAIAATVYGTDAGGTLTATGSAALTYNAGSPTAVKVILPYDSAGVATDWVSAVGAAGVTISLADSYGNAVAAGVTGTVTFTALAGTMGGAGPFPIAGGVCSPTPCTTYTPTKSGSDLAFGSFDLISATLTVTAPASLVGTYTGSSHQLTIGYISTTVVGAAPTVTIYSAPYSGAGNVRAGTPVNVAYTFAGPQKGINVNFTLIADPATGYTGTFANGKSWIVVTSSASGIATANFTADTTAGDDATVKAVVWEPTTAAPTTKVTSAATAALTSGVAAPAALLVQLYKTTGPLTGLTSYTSPNAHLYVDVKLQDAYSNPVSWTNVFALQIALTTSAGGLSATSVYISNGNPDTSTSGFTIQYTAPGTVGDQTITASTTQTGIKASTSTIHVVSLNPVVKITSPSTTSLSANAQTIKGYGVPSKAAVAGTAVVSFTYTLNGAAAVTTGVTGTNSSGASFFSFSVTFANGTNTLTISATDSASNTGTVTQTFTVTHAPPPSFATSQVVQGTPNKATIGGYTGINATFKNTWTSAENEIVFAVWKNSAGQTIAVTTGGLSLASGATGSAFMPLLGGLASGTYTVNIFVVTTSNAPDSVTTTITVTV